MNVLLLETKNIKKSFHTKQVLNGIDMVIEKGEIHGLVGKNGAGKSTFVNIVTGLIDNYLGDVIFEGENINEYNVLKRQEKGLFIVPQHTAIINEFSVAENIFIGVWPKTKANFVDWNHIYETAKTVLQQYGLDIDSRMKASKLNLVDRRKLNIVRALFSESKLIILDEPTTSLTTEERNNLFDFVNEMSEKGTSFIFISHYLDEVLKLCDKITIFKDGYATSLDLKTEKNEMDLSAKMLGESVELFKRDKKSDFSEVAFSCKGIRAFRVDDVSFEINKGDIIGFVGFPGSGAREIMRAIGGLERMEQGELYCMGDTFKVENESEAIQHGMIYVPFDRHDEGLVQEMSILHNISLSVMNGKLKKPMGVIDNKKEAEISKYYYDLLEIKAKNEKEKVRTLSGGNQQKVLIAKELCCEPRLLMLDEPTIGIDIGSREEILNLVNDLANNGTPIIYHTSDYSEILRICDKIYFFYNGKLFKQISNDSLTIDDVANIRDSSKGALEHERENAEIA